LKGFIFTSLIVCYIYAIFGVVKCVIVCDNYVAVERNTKMGVLMTVETERMNITIQKDLVMDLKKLTSPRKRSAFINEAIKQKLEQQKKEKLEMLLEEGYKNRSQESIDLSGEFAGIDVENWDEY